MGPAAATWVAGAGTLGQLLGMNQQKNAAKKAAAGESAAVQQVQNIVNWLTGPEGPAIVQSDVMKGNTQAINTYLDRLHNLVNPAGTIKDLRAQGLQAGIEAGNRFRLGAATEAANLESGIAQTYGNAATGAAGAASATNLGPIIAMLMQAVSRRSPSASTALDPTTPFPSGDLTAPFAAQPGGIFGPPGAPNWANAPWMTTPGWVTSGPTGSMTPGYTGPGQ
jgi:hypothetical protein